MPLQFAAMEKDVDINRVVRQHAEMEDFFTGGFAVKGKNPVREQREQEDNAAAAEAAKGLEKLLIIHLSNSTIIN